MGGHFDREGALGSRGALGHGNYTPKRELHLQHQSGLQCTRMRESALGTWEIHECQRSLINRLHVYDYKNVRE